LLDKKSAIGLFGGTFNPVHLGHVHAAKVVASTFGLGRVMFIPSYIPPHKGDENVAPADDRLKMVELACRLDARFAASDIEVRAGEKSYSVITVEKIKMTFAGSRLFFILGIDAFLEIRTWRDYRKLLGLCSFIVMNRPGYNLLTARAVLEDNQKSMMAPAAGRGKVPGEVVNRYRIFPIRIRPLDISSTEIRRRVRAGESLDGLAPASVAEYIREKKLYSV